LHNPANKQTNADEDITSLAEVKIWVVQVFFSACSSRCEAWLCLSA